MGCAASSASVSKLCGCGLDRCATPPSLKELRCCSVCSGYERFLCTLQASNATCMCSKLANPGFRLHLCPNWLTLGFDYICAQIG